MLKDVQIACAEKVEGWVAAYGSELWRQRLWYRVQDTLSTQLSTDASNPENNRFLASLSLLCAAAYMPPAVISSKSADLVSYAIKALTSTEAHSNDITASVYQTQCLQCLHVLARADPSVLSSHVVSTVPLLLKLAVTSAKHKDRALALSCLQYVASLPYSLLHPHKVTVLKRLRVIANDRKKVVRCMAAECGAAWQTVKK